MAYTTNSVQANDVVRAYVQEIGRAPKYSYITVTVEPSVSLSLPDGPAGPVVARALAAELLRVAEEFDALFSAPAAPELVAPEGDPRR